MRASRLLPRGRSLAALGGVLAALPAPAVASPGQESILMDDAQIVYAAPDRLPGLLAEIRSLGVDRIRVSVQWQLIAPDPDSKERPSFGAAGPASPAGYHPDRWDRYDRIVNTAQSVGLDVLFTLTGPAPRWATGRPERPDIEKTYEPSPADFRDFATAVGTRYSGSYRDEVAQQGGGGLLGSPPPQQGPLLPRVTTWSLWNEPNHPGWLTPSWIPDPRGGRRRMLAAAPRIYRTLVDAGWAGLEASGHAGDTVLLGETAPRGLSERRLTRPIRPLEFIRELYCLDRRLRPFTGSNAEVRGCPGSAAAFVEQHPGLLRASGWAHHPYALEQPPRESDPHPDNVVLADLDRLTGLLDRIYASHGSAARLPLWLTEYGYQTDPPDPTLGIPWSRQAAYLSEGDYIAYRERRVAAVAQFLLFDDGPLREFPPSDPRHWGTFQSGLRTAAGTPKSAYVSYQRPIQAAPSRLRRGRSTRIWGQLRTAPFGQTVRARLELRSVRGRGWGTISEVTSDNPRGYLSVRIRPRRSGWYRLVWRDPDSGRDLPSRRVKVSVVARPRPARAGARRR